MYHRRNKQWRVTSKFGKGCMGMALVSHVTTCGRCCSVSDVLSRLELTSLWNWRVDMLTRVFMWNHLITWLVNVIRFVVFIFSFHLRWSLPPLDVIQVTTHHGLSWNTRPGRMLRTPGNEGSALGWSWSFNTIPIDATVTVNVVLQQGTHMNRIWCVGATEDDMEMSHRFHPLKMYVVSHKSFLLIYMYHHRMWRRWRGIPKTCKPSRSLLILQILSPPPVVLSLS